jgi:Zn-dependent oligopeptidase
VPFDYATASPASVAAEADRALADAAAIVASATGDGAPRSVATTLLPLDHARGVVGEAMGSAGFMAYVHPDADVRAAAHEANERLERWAVDLPFDPQVAAAVDELGASREATSLTGELARLLEFTQRDVRLAGHDLAPAAREEVRAAMARLVEIGVRFNQHIAEVTDVLLVDEADLDGLPDEYREGLARADDGRYRITMAYPDVIPFLENATSRERRRELSTMFNNRAADTNTALLAEAVALRERVAELFGRPSWAHHTMDEKMAHDPETVEAFYDDLVPALTKKAQDEIAVMAARLAQDGDGDELRLWDWRYYDTQLRKSEYGVDLHAVAAYFPLQQVLDGMLEITAEVFGLEYRPLTGVSVWHPDVRSFTIVDRDTDAAIAVVHMDLHPRDGKFSHAAAFDLVPGRRLPDGSYRTPVSAIVANLTKPTAEGPSLLLHDEVVTLFHEFGHILHQTLTKATTARFSGTGTERDFVEAPSQIMEHWCWRPEVLTRFARHHRTGEPIPVEVVDQLVAARDLNVAVVTLRQVQFGVLDMGLHGPRQPEDGTTSDGGRDLGAILRRAESVALFDQGEGTFMPASFGHLLSGYEAGYYGYLWSKVYGDDMFSKFAADGVTNPAVGRAYRSAILERGGSVPATRMLEDFLGRVPNNEAFLAGLGISTRER